MGKSWNSKGNNSIKYGKNMTGQYYYRTNKENEIKDEEK